VEERDESREARRSTTGARAAPRDGTGANGVDPEDAGSMPLSLGVEGQAQHRRSGVGKRDPSSARTQPPPELRHRCGSSGASA